MTETAEVVRRGQRHRKCPPPVATSSSPLLKPPGDVGDRASTSVAAGK
jgi:hypothetical protein